jgi:NADH:ubiquinone oxidoreductase subunit 6 (subunit J)
MGFVLSVIEWVIPALALLVVAWNRLNTPPTNRSGTTFGLFIFGVIFYYALILALWLLIAMGGFSAAMGGVSFFVSLADPATRAQISQFAPIVAALIIVVASQFSRVNQIDTAARKFCQSLAHIPREADRLSFELAQSADFQPPTEQLRRQVTEFISENIHSQAVNFDRDGTLPARFTKAVALHWLFIRPKHDNTPPEFSTSAYGISAYSTIMNFHEAIANRADARYEEMIRESLAYFTSAHPTKELKAALCKTITELSNLVCSLIARYVLYCDVTRRGQRQRLSSMGFNVAPRSPFGPNQWAATILAVIILSIALMVWMPGTKPLAAPQILMIAIYVALPIGIAVMAAVVVARRFIERHEGEKPAYPPFAELLVAALIVVGLAMAIRIAIPIVPALIEGDRAALQDVFKQFWERLAGVITPFTCTISLGLLCSRVDLLKGTSLRVAAVGAIGNGLAFLTAGFFVGNLFNDSVLAQFFYLGPDQARLIIVANTGITGTVIGAMVLAAFGKSEKDRKDDKAHGGLARDHTSLPAENLEFSVPSPPDGAAKILGAYSRSNVEELEGCYVCFRPAFTGANVITAYLVVIRWDEAESCLMFEEQGHADAAHPQKGHIYIPDGRPFMSLVTIEKGAMRLIMVSRPQKPEPARGLIMTLSNPSAMHFTPASAPIVLRPVSREIPQIGFIRPDSPDYDAYRRELETVMPTFGLFGTVPRPVAEPEVRLAGSGEGRCLSAVRCPTPPPRPNPRPKKEPRPRSSTI